MPASFHAFIDEAGDEGFKFLPNETGSSRWFVLSAVVFRNSNALAPVRILKESRELLKRDAKAVLHFRNLKHEHRRAFTAVIAKEKLLTVSVLSYKPDIPEPENYQNEKFLLYKYLTRLLVERVSWLARDFRKDGDGDGTVQLIFSDRAAMSYADLREYLSMLKAQSQFADKVNIHWPAIDLGAIKAVAHEKLAGLQVADAVASGLYYAVNLNQFGQAEPGYFELLRSNVYSYKGARIGYGLKFLSKLPTLKEKMPHLQAAFGDW